jgi:hypothetical protein
MLTENGKRKSLKFIKEPMQLKKAYILLFYEFSSDAVAHSEII